MTLQLEAGSLPYVAHCDGEGCSDSQEVFGNTLQYAREDLVHTHKWILTGNPNQPSEPLTFCTTCKKHHQ